MFRGLATAAFGELAIMPEVGVVKVDPDVPLEVACVLGCAVQTGVGAVLNTAKVEEGATVLVLGAGGIGIAVTQGARLAGAAMIVVSDPSEERREAAKRFGATHVLDPTAGDVPSACLELTGGIGMDYCFEAAGQASLHRGRHRRHPPRRHHRRRRCPADRPGHHHPRRRRVHGDGEEVHRLPARQLRLAPRDPPAARRSGRPAASTSRA